MTNESTAPVRIGDVLAGKYRVARVLGEGGMGVVVEALHIELDQRVALKFMLPAAAANEAAVERFAREARASAKLRSDNVVHVTDVGTLESGAPYMVMEFLEGEDLGQLLAARGRLAVDDAIDYVLQACAGLAEAHAAGIVHRDLKPANLVLARRDDTVSVVKIVDFGISKVSVPGVADKLTSTKDLMGSPLYMSPEQLASARDVDARTDIWSLGIILYELLSGVLPFDGDTLPQICTAVLIAPAPPVLEKRAELPSGLSAVVAKCLEKKPADRYGSVGELADALAEFAPPQSLATLQRIARLGPVSVVAREEARPPRAELAPRVEPHRETASPWTPAELGVLPRRSARRAWVVGAFASALLLLAGAFAFALAQRGSVRDDSTVRSQTGAPVDRGAAAQPAIPAAPSASVQEGSTPPTSATAAPLARRPAPPRPNAGIARPAWTAGPAASGTAAAAPTVPPSGAPSGEASAAPSGDPSRSPALAPSSSSSASPPPPAPSATPSLPSLPSLPPPSPAGGPDIP